MKNILTILAVLISILPVYAQTVDSPYEVGIWQGFRSAAISYTFDDGSPNHYAKAIPLFDEFGYHLTMFTITNWTGWAPNWTTLKNASLQGHEIASHTVTHTSLGDLNDSLQTIELKQSRDDIDSYITNTKCITIAYPFCVASKKSITSEYYIAARICSGNIEPKTPRDFMNISSIICGELGSLKTTEDFVKRFDSAVNSNGWCVLLIHGVDGDGGWSSLPSTTLRETLEYTKEKDDDMWVETFGNVARYIKERDDVSVSEVSVEDTTIILNVTDTLPDSIFNYPVSVRRPLPEGWTSAKVAQNGVQVESKITEENSVKYVQFDVIPDAGEIIITGDNSTKVINRTGKNVKNPALLNNYPNPFNPVTTIQFDLANSGRVTLKVLDTLGREVETLLDKEVALGQHSVAFQADGLASGVYFVSLQGEDFVTYHKMLLLR